MISFILNKKSRICLESKKLNKIENHKTMILTIPMCNKQEGWIINTVYSLLEIGHCMVNLFFICKGE